MEHIGSHHNHEDEYSSEPARLVDSPTVIADKSPDSISSIDNLGNYEREKIERTLEDVETLAAVIGNYLDMVTFCDARNIQIQERSSLNDLRHTGQQADPAGAILSLTVTFQHGMEEIARSIPHEMKALLKDQQLLKKSPQLSYNDNIDRI